MLTVHQIRPPFTQLQNFLIKPPWRYHLTVIPSLLPVLEEDWAKRMRIQLEHHHLHSYHVA